MPLWAMCFLWQLLTDHRQHIGRGVWLGCRKTVDAELGMSWFSCVFKGFPSLDYFSAIGKCKKHSQLVGHVKPGGRPSRCLLTPVVTSCIMASQAPCPVSLIPLPSLPWAGGWPGSVSTLMYCSGTPFSDTFCVFLFSGSTLALFLLSCICVIFQSHGLVSSIVIFVWASDVIYGNLSPSSG